MNLFKRFSIYQDKRFPLKILFFTTLTSVISSAAVINYEVSLWQIAGAFFAVLFFMFHIRVLDESRDYKHDAQYHKDSPLHDGTIKLNQLVKIDIVTMLAVVGIALYFGFCSFIVLLMLLAFTTLAWRDFFMKRFFRYRNVLYHLVNSPQMILLQFLIYTVYISSFDFSAAMWLNLLLMYNNVFVLEVVRKIKSPLSESQVPDTYSKDLGYKKSITLLFVLSLVSLGVYLILLTELMQNFVVFAILGGIFMLFIALASWFHNKKREAKTEKLLVLSAFLEYVGLNTLVCLAVL